LLRRYHSATAIPAPDPPPLFIGAGFTDDLFPVDETLRFARLARRPVSLLFGDFGHQRAANKPAERKLLLSDIHAWFDRYLRGRRTSPAPRRGVVAFAQTCPRTKPSLGPFSARSFKRLARRTVVARGSSVQTLSSDGGSPTVGAAIDPVAGGGDGCATVDAADQSAVATYRLPVKRPFTLLGAPRVRAQLTVAGARPEDAQIASRLWDVAPDGTQRLVARGSYRPVGDHWLLHANGWRFARGHTVKLELLGNDAPYTRPSNGSFTITVAKLRLILPRR
jgi:predicted acyl esterase